MTAFLSKLSLAASALALSIGPSAFAQTKAAPTPVAATEVPAAQKEMAGPALWRVADEDTTIYIFGTVHALPDDIDWYTGPVKTALDESDTLVTEVDMTPEAEAELGALMQRMAVLPEGETLRGLLTGEQRLMYETALGEMGVPAEALDRLKPWVATLTLAQIAFQKAGITGENGSEQVLEGVVGETKARGALETAASQLEIFDGLPREAQIDYLMQTVEEVDAMVPMLQQVIDLWAVGNVDDLGDLLNEGFESDPVLANRLLYNRNANWAEWIDERLDRPGAIFMAVGAGHLAGDRSVQDYLAERDIAITRVQ